MAAEEVSERRWDWGPIAWVAAVLALGAVVGEAIVAFVHPHHQLSGPAPIHGMYPPLIFQQATVLSTIDVALLLALLFVHSKTYLETRARFALGLVIVLAALTIHTVFSSPLSFDALGFGPGGLDLFFFVSSVFETVALTLFLWISLA